MKNKAIPLSVLTAIAFLFLTYFLGYQLDRTEFTFLSAHLSLFFLLYIAVFHYSQDEKTIFFFVGIGVLLRFLLIFAFPNLSDDIYRFIWDGHLLIQGINPFDQLPTFYIENTSTIPGITKDLYQQLNSPNYFTIYPPVNQFIFATAAYLSPTSWWGSSVVMKSFLFVMELGSLLLIIQLLRHFKLPLKNVVLYALNPLIIFEIMGNIHFEGAMIFFLLLSIWLIIVKKRLVWSAIAFALSVASKLLPLIFLPFFIARLSQNKRALATPSTPTALFWFTTIDWKRNSLFFAVLGISLLLLFLPLLSGAFFSNFGASLNLYFKKFEFNASLYYFFRWVGFQYKGYNVIQSLGPALSIMVLVGILWTMFQEQSPNWTNLFNKLLFAITFYLLLAMTIHPWYVALPIVCCLFTNYRFPIVWSGLVFLTYINYSYAAYYENLWIVGIEYVVVSIFALREFIYTTDNLKTTDLDVDI